MAIEFEVDEKNKNKEDLKQQQKQENEQAKLEGRKAKKIKPPKIKKSGLAKWSDVLLAFSIIALIYALTYSVSGLVVLIPALVLWIVWVCIMLIPTVATFGAVWFSDSWKSFNKSFIEFNKKISDTSLGTSEILYKIFPYLASFFLVCIISFLIVSIVGFSKRKKIKEKFTAKFVVSIIFTIIFIIALVVDVSTFLKLKF